jgi:hypothetical protein
MLICSLFLDKAYNGKEKNILDFLDDVSLMESVISLL